MTGSGGGSGRPGAERVPRRSPEVLEEEFDGELVLCEPVREQVVLLNETGAAVWELCDGSLSVAEIVALLADQTGAERETVAADVAAFVEDLVARGFLALEEAGEAAGGGA